MLTETQVKGCKKQGRKDHQKGREYNPPTEIGDSIWIGWLSDSIRFDDEEELEQGRKAYKKGWKQAGEDADMSSED